MKRMFCLLGCVFQVCFLYAQKPEADVFLRVTNERETFSTMATYKGVFTITNIGLVPFSVVTNVSNMGLASIADMVYFYRDYDGERKRWEDEHEGGQIKDQQRRQVIENYRNMHEKGVKSKLLRPGESVSVECPAFGFEGLWYGDIFKADMYLGDDTWEPVCITPTIGIMRPLSKVKGESAVVFYYSKEGTNQYLYLKLDDKFKRICEMKLGSKPKQDKDVVIIESVDGVRKKLTRDAATRIVIDRERDGGTDEMKKAVE